MPKTNLFQNTDQYETFSAGQTIFEAGQSGDTMYVVKQGEVELLLGENVLETLTAGDTFGEMALIEKKSRSAGARAKTETQLVPINEKQFVFYVQQTPYFALNVMQTMAERLRRMDEMERKK